MSHYTVLAAKKELAVRGKYAEEKVRDQLKKWSAGTAGFDFKRNYDGRSSMGRIPKQAGDFDFYGCVPPLAGEPGFKYHGVIEVKQVAHDFRLPRKNFNPDGFPILKKREMAGGKVVVIVLHTTTKKWRCPPFGWFVSLADRASWDLSVWPQYDTLEEAMAAAKFH